MNEEPSITRRTIRHAYRWIVKPILIVIVIICTIFLVNAFRSRGMPVLEAWHRVDLDDFTAADLTPEYDLAQYLKLEDRLFAEVSGIMIDPDALGGRSPLLRYVKGGPQDPARQPVNWNRSIELAPEKPTGGALLLHGLSDAPYSLERLAEQLEGHGFHVLVMRMPGHGTAPAGLLDVRWEDWAAAVKVGARSVTSRLDDSMPFFVAGYSNGGALAVDYCCDALEDDGYRVPDRLFLFSPAIGITPFARIARWDKMYSFIPYFEKSKWLDIMPEFDPHKYNSFPNNAGTQSWRLARAIQTKLDRLHAQGRAAEIPPILTFQSLVDDTVSVEALITRLYDRLDDDGSEVVLFDVNHASDLDGFLAHDLQGPIDQLMDRTNLPYAATRITNGGIGTRRVHAVSRPPRSTTTVEEPLDHDWPPGVYSLAHVAIPFAPEDALYGAAPADPGAFGIHIGAIEVRGERRVLRVPASMLTRMRYNPFHAYMARRIDEAVTSHRQNDAPGGAGSERP